MTARRPTVRLFWLFFSLYALTSSGNAFRVPDEFEVYFQTEHLVDAGDISVPQTLEIREGGQPIFFGQFGLDGRPYAPYGPGVATPTMERTTASEIPRLDVPQGSLGQDQPG